jgi:ATP-dependent Clp protease ATP-binding subunit ClpB
MIRMQLGSLPLPIDRKERELAGLIVKKEALRREDTELAKAEREKLEQSIAQLQEDLATIRQQWDKEKQVLDGLKAKKEELEQLRFQEEDAERQSDYNAVARLRYNDIPALKKAIDEAEKALAENPKRLLQEEVDEALIAQIVSKWTGIPVDKMLEGEAERLLRLESHIAQRVIGQEMAIEAVSEAIRRSRSGLSDPKRPMGAFLFLGPTGVGKTELAKALAELLFQDEEAIIRLDMSEYMERHTVAKLIGSPPGYVGYDEGGQLTEALRRRPYAVVLLDEVEKAHHDVFNVLLQVFDDGRLTDSKGRTVNCKNALFIMTSNLGSDRLMAKLEASEEGSVGKEELLSTLEPVVKAHFRPEFLNRLDEILPFLPLRKKDMAAIVAIQLQRVAKRLEDKRVRLCWSDEVQSYLADIGYDAAFGARPLKRLIEQKVTNSLAKGVLENKILSEHTIELVMKEGEISWRVRD